MRCHGEAMRSLTPTIRGTLFLRAFPRSARCREVLRCGTFRAAIRMLVAASVVVASPCTQYAAAQETVPVETTLVAEVLKKIEVSDGRQVQRLVPASVIAQGDVVYYTVKIRNPTATPARELAVVQRIPANTTYVPNSASGPSADITFSVDGGVSFKSAKDLTVVLPTGATRPALPHDYTHIRWQLRNALAPGAVALTRFQAVFR